MYGNDFVENYGKISRNFITNPGSNQICAIYLVSPHFPADWGWIWSMVDPRCSILIKVLISAPLSPAYGRARNEPSAKFYNHGEVVLGPSPG